MKDKLAIIVPYRDREKHLNIFVPHMHEFLKDKGIDYDIIITEQADDRPFNYGKLCNVAVKEVGEEYTYFAFHDIDMLPVSDECDYSFSDEPIHLALNVEAHKNKLPYPQFFGGVKIINKEDFLKINGFSNEYWGYGFEDLDLLKRMEKSGTYLEKFYDENRVYSNYNELDTLPYRIENVKISNNNNNEIISYNDFDNGDFFQGQINKKTLSVINDTFSVILWFKDDSDREERKEIFCFEGYNTGVFLEKGNEIIFQIWDNKTNHYEIIVPYSRNRWNQVVLSFDNNTKIMSLVLNKEKTERQLSKSFKLYDYTKHNLRVSDNTTKCKISNILIYGNLVNDEIVDIHYNKNESSLDNIKSKFGIAPLSYFNYKKVYREKFILDSGVNHNHLNINGKINVKHEENNYDVIYLPIRLEGEYKSLKHHQDSKVIERYYQNDPDVEENADIFFHEMIEGTLDFKKFGLKSLNYSIMDTIEFEDYKLIRVVT